MGGDRALGRISLQNLDRTNAFSDSDVRLLTTLAGSLSVALENARLFDETQRLLTETNERAAELAIINSVQQGLAAKLDMQSMYDLVGDKIQEIFDAQVVNIFLYDLDDGAVDFPLRPRTGRAARRPERPLQPDHPRLVIEAQGKPIASSTMRMSCWRGWASKCRRRRASGRSRWSCAADRAAARRSAASRSRTSTATHAFSEADVRLLTTLASSLSVALENARLFDETQRLLKETNERAAELAIINSVQEGLAAQLDMQAMYDLVGDKIQEIFDAQVVDIGLYDFETKTLSFPYSIERGVRFPDEPAPFTDATWELINGRRPVLIRRRQRPMKRGA